VDSELLNAGNLDPGSYIAKVLQLVLDKHVPLTECVDVLHPSTVYSGKACKVLTLDDYSFQGVVPQKLKLSRSVTADRNYARVGDVLLNRLKSHKKRPLKSTVILDGLDYLAQFGLSLKGSSTQISLPLYEHILILRMKSSSRISAYYLALVLNSDIMRQVADHLMYGSTGRSYFSMTTLRTLKIPTLPDDIMKSFSKATEISLRAFSETLRMLIGLQQIFQQTVLGEAKIDEIRDFIRKQDDVLTLQGHALDSENQSLSVTESVSYAEQ
jgi:hypothetical protein